MQDRKKPTNSDLAEKNLWDIYNLNHYTSCFTFCKVFFAFFPYFLPLTKDRGKWYDYYDK